MITNPDTYSTKENWPFVEYLDTGNITRGTVSGIQKINRGEPLPSRARRKVLPYDIVYSSVRPINRHYGLISNPLPRMLVSTGFVVIRAKRDRADSRFLYYLLTQDPVVNTLQVIGEHSTSAYPAIKPSDIESLECQLPPLPEQKAIAHVLGSLDDKIELNRQMNATLEAMAQALFKSWFVDFDPVIDNALAAGNSIPDELQARAAARESLGDARKPLPEYIQNLFPASFTNTEELGWIPEGWKVGPLSRVANLSTKAVSPFKQPDKVWTHYSIPAFDEGIQPTRDLGATIKSGKYKVHDDSVLASKLNPQFPRVWLVDANDEDSAICSTEFMPFRPKRAADRFYLYLFLRSDFAQQSIVDRVTGSTGSRQRVKPREISQLKLVIPPENIREPFNQVVSGPLYRVLLNRRATADLAKTRDTLLPKLLSGDLRLPLEELEVAV